MRICVRAITSYNPKNNSNPEKANKMSYDPCFPFRVSIVNQNIFLEALLPWAKV
jgi:hypothetical protein